MTPSSPSPSGSGAGADEGLQTLIEDLVTRLERVEERLRRLDGSRRAEGEPAGHTLFVSTASGYTIVERDSPPPRPGDQVTVDGGAYRAQSYRRSPFPDDLRTCVIVEAAETE